MGVLENIAKREGRATLTKQHDFLCSQSGIDMIKEDIAVEGDDSINRVAIMGCSRRSKMEAFTFGAMPVSRGNLREAVIWVRPDTDEAKETTDEMAADYVRMACAEAKFLKPAESSGQQSLNKRILIVGGGITGMTAAIEISKAGYEACIVEKAGSLGGATGQFWKRVPHKAPYADPEETGVSEMAAAIEADSNITVHLNSTVTKTSGAPGRFSADITTESGGTSTDNFGAILQSSGFKAFDASILTEFAYGKTPDVVDQAGLEKLAIEANGGPIKRPSDGKEITSVAFVQCAGQRSEKEGHLSYCSGSCCSTSIKQAMYFKDQNTDIDTTVIYTDLRTPGVAGEDFYRSGQKKGVLFTKGEVNEVVPGSDSHTVKMKDLILDEDTEMDVDLVVLATGQIANSGVDIEAPAPAEGETSVAVESILNLDYRQGKDLPHLVHGFADSHFICFPYETRRTGIYTAGPVRRPMDIKQAMEDATGAAMKTIQVVENAGKGMAAHPRSGDLSFPTFRKEGCTQCKRCTVECPFGAIDEDDEGYPQYNESRCRRCGTCMGACPVRIISFENYSVDTVGQQLKIVDIPDEFDEKPRILTLACENDAYPALDMAAANGEEHSAFNRIIPVRCLGSVNVIWVTDAMNSGYDGVILMGCQKGENYQCHFVKGSEMAHIRMSKIDDTLTTLNLEKERVATYEVAITDVKRAPELINEMAKTIEKIGMSPFKF
jgi:quinone-modifying oxidoreductase subunit QmoB